MAIVLGNQMNPMPQVAWDFVGNRRKRGPKIKASVIPFTGVVPGPAIIRAVGIFLGLAAGLEFIGLLRDVVDPRPATKEVEETIERWLKERYGHVYRTRVGPRISRRRDKKSLPEPFGLPAPYERVAPTLERMFPEHRVTPRKEEGDPEDEELARWLERRFNGSIVELQKLRF